MTITPYTGPVRDTVSRLAGIEAQVLDTIKLNLLQKVAGVWTQADDNLFENYSAYCVACWHAGIPGRSSEFWESSLHAQAEAADTALSKLTPPTRIHKGAPFFNTGVGYLLAGKLDKGVAWIAQAGQEEALRGSGSTHGLLLGNHQLTEQAILTPLISWMTASLWPAKWQSITSRNLDLPEFKSLINWLSLKAENAIQLVVSLLRMKDIESLPKNEAVMHVRVQAYADLLLVVESSLRAWQTSATYAGMQLYNRLESMLAAKPEALRAFKQAETRFATRFPKDATGNPHPDKETYVAANWVIDDTLTELITATSTAERAGIACHLAARLRNSLMHVIDGSVNLYNDETKYSKVAAITLSVVRLSQAGNEGTLTPLPTT